MKKLLESLSEMAGEAFKEAGYDADLGRVSISSRPDLCELQCNGAMAAAKRYHKPPMEIAEAVAARLTQSPAYDKAVAVPPGFINLDISEAFLSDYLAQMYIDRDGHLGIELTNPVKILVDYGGANVAKPLHVGHIRSAVIGDALKRMLRYMGNDVVGDVHLGDWGLQMGLVITEIRHRQPDLVYFNDEYTGPYPATPPFTISELEELYPEASRKSKEDEVYRAEALEVTRLMQDGHPGYRALWSHIMNVSKADLRKNYGALGVEFEIWKGESDVHELIGPMVDDLKRQGLAYESDGALVVDVKQDSDTKEVPPCMILKSDGAALYSTTDLATLVDRKPLGLDAMIYVSDKRQELHYTQFFRVARLAGIVDEHMKLTWLGFGTMNGADGKPFKTRDGGVMRLESLIAETTEEMYRKIIESGRLTGEEAMDVASKVAIAALKYGDLSNQISKDYIFDIDRFTSFEGDTGPYILYTAVRIKSILVKSTDEVNVREISESAVVSAHKLGLALAQFNESMTDAVQNLAPHRVCAYMYSLCDAFNSFYHETPILSEPDTDKRVGLLALLALTLRVIETCCSVLGIEIPERM